MKHVGIFPGTFDPVHKGHIAFGLEAIRLCKLNEVIFLPERAPRGKQNVTDVQQRAAGLNPAISSLPKLRIAVLKSDQFTVRQTLPEIRQLVGEAELTLLLGSDVARNLAHWDDLEALLRAVSFAIGLRAGDTAADLCIVMQQLAAKHSQAVNYKLITTPHAALSSSRLRTGNHPNLLQ